MSTKRMEIGVLDRFPQVEKKVRELAQSVIAWGEAERVQAVGRHLLACIQEQKTPCFLLGAVNEYIRHVLEQNIVESYSFWHFELFLNHFSGLSDEDNYKVRGKIMGKYVPREVYQVLFPIGMKKRYFGSHYVTAHSSPDLDTTVASFWGWVDAFSARVAEGLHLWNVPGGPPSSQVEIPLLFNQVLGEGCFSCFSKFRGTLGVNALELLSQKGIVRKAVEESSLHIDFDTQGHAVLLVDEKGSYLGDWSPADVEGIRKITILLHSCLRYFVSHIQTGIIAFFAKQEISYAALQSLLRDLFSMTLAQTDPVKEFSSLQRKRFVAYLHKVLGLSQDLQTTFAELSICMQEKGVDAFAAWDVVSGSFASLFDAQGGYKADRCSLFAVIEEMTKSLEAMVQGMRAYVDSLRVALLIKQNVLGNVPAIVSPRMEIEEIRSKMGALPYVVVTTSSRDSEGGEKVLGIIRLADISQSVLGTVSIRDFCNREETKIPPYLEVISIIDHHKSTIGTASAPVAVIGDVQSANALVAELAFGMHDAYSMGGRSRVEVEEELRSYGMPLHSSSLTRIVQRLLQKQEVALRKEEYFIDPKREYLEYLHYLYAILDDTDLLAKVSYRDVICVASLLSRLQTLQLQKEVEVVHFDDIPLDAKFAEKAAARLLRQEEMYALYSKVYAAKERAVETAIALCVQKESSSFFGDTKVQNVCARVGQTKLFPNNISCYDTHAFALCALWYQNAVTYYEQHTECSLHMHMISTVSSAEDVYLGKEGNYAHQDELWIWIPEEELAIEYLQRFLSAFSVSTAIAHAEVSVEFLGKHALMEQAFQESFKPSQKQKHSDRKSKIPVAIVRYKAGLLNSRKAMISPYLPKG